jgi:hypothetical protein
MALSDLASLGSFVSGGAVLVSLIFLYFQLRQIAEQVKQTEKNQRAVLNQGYADRATVNLRWLAESPQAGLITRVLEGETNFTSEELFRLGIAFRSSVVSTQDTLLQHRAGLVDDMTLENSLLGLAQAYLCQPVYRALWEGHKASIAPDFRVEIDTMIARTELAKPADRVTNFQINLARVVGVRTLSDRASPLSSSLVQPPLKASVD